MSVYRNRQLIQTLRDLANTQREIINTTRNIPNPATDIKQLKQLIGKENQTSLGSKFIKAGIFLVIGIPEPVVSDLAGAALIATGYTMNKLTNHATIRDVFTTINKTTKDIAQFKKELTNFTL